MDLPKVKKKFQLRIANYYTYIYAAAIKITKRKVEKFLYILKCQKCFYRICHVAYANAKIFFVTVEKFRKRKGYITLFYLP